MSAASNLADLRAAQQIVPMVTIPYLYAQDPLVVASANLIDVTVQEWEPLASQVRVGNNIRDVSIGYVYTTNWTVFLLEGTSIRDVTIVGTAPWQGSIDMSVDCSIRSLTFLTYGDGSASAFADCGSNDHIQSISVDGGVCGIGAAGCTGLTALSLTYLTSMEYLNCAGCTGLAGGTITLGGAGYVNGDVSFADCGLSQSQVDGILATMESLWTWQSYYAVTIDLTGNAAPSAAGLASIAAILVLSPGITVTHE